MRAAQFGLVAAGLSLASISGCVQIPDGHYACASTEDCPSGFSCRSGRCYRGEGPALDAGPVDVGQLDGGAPDAADAGAVRSDGGGGRYAFVVSDITYGVGAGSPATAPGRDIDGMEGGDRSHPCTQQMDFVSTFDGSTGVDNQYPFLAPSIEALRAGSDARAAIRGGRYLLLVELSAVDSWMDDPAVSVRLALGQPSSGAVVTTARGLAADQSFVVTQEIGRATGSITAGSLRASVGTSLPTWSHESTFTLSMSDVELALHVTESAAAGDLSGTITVADVVSYVAALGTSVEVTAIEASASPDLMPNADGSHCAGISVGLALELVRARF